MKRNFQIQGMVDKVIQHLPFNNWLQTWLAIEQTPQKGLTMPINT
jgi:hypothetical protein